MIDLKSVLKDLLTEIWPKKKTLSMWSSTCIFDPGFSFLNMLIFYYQIGKQERGYLNVVGEI